jgi:hypothetical protein
LAEHASLIAYEDIPFAGRQVTIVFSQGRNARCKGGETIVPSNHFAQIGTRKSQQAIDVGNLESVKQNHRRGDNYEFESDVEDFSGFKRSY